MSDNIDVNKYRLLPGEEIRKQYVVVADTAHVVTRLRSSYIEGKKFAYPPDDLYSTYAKFDEILMDTENPPDEWERFDLHKVYFQCGR